MQIDLVSEALTFMLLGMGIVFVFIILMIIAMNILRAFVQRCFPDDTSGPAAGSTGSTASAAQVASQKSNNKIAAIIGAICRQQESK